MKNITVSLPDDVYRRARVRAAERDSTVSALVREFLVRFAATGEDSEFAQLRQLQDDVLATVARFRAAGRVSREKAHQRNSPKLRRPRRSLAEGGRIPVSRFPV